MLDHKIEDRMESFFLAETTKYLYLLFDPDNFIHNNGSCGELIQMSGGNCIIGAGGYVFNTEAHPIDIGAVYCCSARHHDHQLHLYEFQKNMDLHSLLEISDKEFFNTFKSKNTFKGRNPKFKLISSTLQKNDSDEGDSNGSLYDMNSTVILNYFLNTSYTIDNNYTIDDNLDNSILQPSLKLSSNENLQNITDNYSLLMPLNINLQSNVSNVKNDNSSLFSENELKSNVSLEQPIITSSTQAFNETLFQNSFNITPEGQLKSEVLNEINSSLSKDINLETQSTEINLNFTGVAFEIEGKDVISSSLNDPYDHEFYKYELLMCPAQPFTARLNIMGEMFNV